MKVEFASNGNVPIKMWTDHVPVEEQALAQLGEMAQLPFIHKHIAVMPDVHLGYGATVGSVIPMKGALVPTAVGVDIGCGMIAKRLGMTSEHLPENLANLRAAIEKVIPVGRGCHQHPVFAKWEAGKLWEPQVANKDGGTWSRYNVIPGGLLDRKQTPEMQLGTLGGGNHFVEVCLDEDDNVWIVLHSGSRGIGNRVGQHFINLAKRECERWMIDLPNKDLAYLPEGTEGFDDYIAAVSWCQDYAAINREIMMRRTFNAIVAELGCWPVASRGTVISCHHNYVERENHFSSNVWVTRKGAVRAREGDLGIIPGSMGDRSFIVRGKGNPESFDSCSHGAGRIMSRTEAKRTFTVEDHIQATLGVECRKDEGVIDETPGSYKNIDDVMASQDDLVDIVHTLKQVLCVKG